MSAGGHSIARVVRLIAACMPAILCSVPRESGAQVTKGKYLYTEPDPSSKGGIAGRILQPAIAIDAVYALAQDDYRKVYKGRVAGDGNREFMFEGLPPGKYDLVVVYPDAVCEGVTLSRQGDTLTAQDRKDIETVIDKSEPFWNEKRVWRVEGTSGKGDGNARCVCHYLRTRNMVDYNYDTYTDHRRSLKLVLLENVGPGWQIWKTREIHTVFVKPGKGTGEHGYSGSLHGVRVADGIKDLGEISLDTGEK